MRPYFLALAYLISFLIFGACQNTKSTSCNDVLSVSRLDDLDIIEKIETVDLDNRIPISSVRKIDICDSTIFVLSQEGLNCYDLKGKHLRQISQCGRAENEWLYINTFFLSPDKSSICLVDGQGDKMLWFDIDGNHIRTVHADTGTLSSVKNAEEMSDGNTPLLSEKRQVNGNPAFRFSCSDI